MRIKDYIKTAKDFKAKLNLHGVKLKPIELVQKERSALFQIERTQRWIIELEKKFTTDIESMSGEKLLSLRSQLVNDTSMLHKIGDSYRDSTSTHLRCRNSNRSQGYLGKICRNVKCRDSHTQVSWNEILPTITSEVKSTSKFTRPERCNRIRAETSTTGGTSSRSVTCPTTFNAQQQQIQYFISWRAVWKGNSFSTPCRIVFDASQATASGYNLNDLLAKGRNYLNKLQEILI